MVFFRYFLCIKNTVFLIVPTKINVSKCASNTLEHFSSTIFQIKISIKFIPKKIYLWNHTSLGQFGRDPHTSQNFDMEVDFILDFFLWIFSAYFNCLDNRSSLTGISGNYGVILICVKWFNTQFCWIHTKVSESKIYWRTEGLFSLTKKRNTLTHNKTHSIQ